MGVSSFLDKPKRLKKCEHGSNETTWWGTCSMQGWRQAMEDTHICSPIDLAEGVKGMLFAVFDGHGGDEVANFAKEKF